MWRFQMKQIPNDKIKLQPATNSLQWEAISQWIFSQKP